MDQIKTGKFIARLRREVSLTQAELGERVGVSNKTVSRWENGNYMPDIGTLQMLAKEFNVSVDELLAGERASDGKSCDTEGDKDTVEAWESAFSLEDRRAYFKKKWRREHILLFVLLGAILLASLALPLIFDRPEFLGLAPLTTLCEYACQNNMMMKYVEKNLYDR